MRIQYLFILAAFTPLLVCAQQTPFSTIPQQNAFNAEPVESSNGIIAVVENRIITLYELREEVALLLPQIQRDTRNQNEFEAKVEQVGKEMLQNLIDRALTINEFNKEGMQVPPSYIENELDDFIITNFDNDRAKFIEMLRDRGQSMREFRRELEEQLIVRFMRSRFRNSIGEVSPEKIELFYEENKDAFFQEESLLLKQITLAPKEGQDLASLEAKAQEIIQKLDQGEDFSELALEYSQDEKAREGGEWGWIDRSDIRKELSDIAFELPKGAYSEPITLDGYIFILASEDKREAGTKSLAEVRKIIENQILDDLTRQAQKRWLSRLRDKAYIKIYL